MLPAAIIAGLFGLKLAGLLRDHWDRFHCDLLREPTDSQISSILVIDADRPERNVPVPMLSTEQLRGIESSFLACTAILVGGRRTLASDTRRRILELVEQCVEIDGRRCDGSTSLDELSGPGVIAPVERTRRCRLPEGRRRLGPEGRACGPGLPSRVRDGARRDLALDVERRGGQNHGCFIASHHGGDRRRSDRCDGTTRRCTR